MIDDIIEKYLTENIDSFDKDIEQWIQLVRDSKNIEDLDKQIEHGKEFYKKYKKRFSDLYINDGKPFIKNYEVVHFGYLMREIIRDLDDSPNQRMNSMSNKNAILRSFK